MSEYRSPLFERRRSHLLVLEPRMMFDAAAAVVAQDAMAASDASAHGPVFADADHATADHHADQSIPAHETAQAADRSTVDGPAATVTTTPHDVIFIDTAIDDYKQLAAEWADRGQVVLIDSSRDGIAQMQAALAGQSDIGAIHIVSHGTEGMFFLGTTKVDEAAITGSLASALGSIGSSLKAGGDILIYGCDFAEGSDGASALTAFAAATHADVAASTDLTGYAGLGGDWTLEAHRGAIEAHTLDSSDWVHTLDPNTPVPISVSADSLTVKDGAGNTVVDGTTGYGTDARSPDVGVGSVATWHGAATYQGQSVDLVATVVSLSTGDAIRFNRPTGPSSNPASTGDDPTFLLRDLTTANDATVQIRWSLVLSSNGAALPADVRFTIADIDGIGGNPNTRESVTASTAGLAYYTRENVSDINFVSSLDAITASGTQNENTVANQPLTTKSAATFDWSSVSSFTLTYKLTTNTVTTQAQFYHDGNAQFTYTDPVYVSIPRLDLDGNDSTATGNDAHFTFTENGASVPIVDSDVVVSNPMDINSITGGSVRLTNYQAGDTFTIGTLPSNITATIGAVVGGTQTITLSGLGSESDYDAAFRAISYRNTSEAPSATQRVIEVSFSNNTLTSAIATSRIDVIPVNDPPSTVGTLPARSTSDAASVSYATAGGFTDVDGDTLTYSATGLPAGLTIDSASGVISGTLDRSASQVNGGSYSVVVTARDPSNTTATQTFTIAVTNPAPTAANDSATTNEDTAVNIAVLANDRDPDGDPLTVIAATAQHGAVVRNADGTITYTPNANYNGSDKIDYTISDGQGGTASAQVAVTITPVNDAPTRVGTLPARSDVDAGTPSFGTASAFTDVDGDTLTYSATGLPAGLTINAATGVISGTIDRSASQVNGGSYAVVVTARDPSNATATQSFTYTVTNPAPVAANDSVTTNEDAAVVISVLANDRDPDGDPLTVIAASALHGTVVRNGNGTLTYTPNANYNGSDTINYTISDGEGGTSSAQVAVTINPVNDAPTPVGTLPARNGADAGTVSFGTAGGFTDVDGDTLTYSATGLPAGLTINASTGVISGTLDRSASQVNGGAYSVVVTARDPSNTTATQTFSYTVTNPAPTAVNDSVTTPEDTAVAIAVLANDSDPDGDPLTVTAASALHGSVVRNADGTITYTPDADYNGSDTISYSISDGQGGTSSATVAVTITPVNDAPHVVTPPPSYAAADGSQVSVSVANAFTDPDGDALTYTATGLPAGLTLDGASGIISGTLDRSASQVNGGAYAITVTATDPSHASATQTVAMTVTNPAPTAADDSATTPEDTAVIIPVLANDRDPDGDPLTVTSATALHGAVTINPDGTLTYTPNANYNGADTISYAISDGQGGTSSAHVAVTVTPVNDPPMPVGSLPTRSTLDGATVRYPTATGFSDADGDTLAFSATGLPAGLTIDSATGIISGTLDRSASQPNGGHYVVTVTARDPSNATGTQSFTIDVANPAPRAADDSVTTHVDTAITIAVLGNDSDPDGDPLTVTSATGASHGSVAINPDGTLRYTPNAGYAGTDTLTYTISDGQGGTATATVTIMITDAPPVAGAGFPFAALDGQAISLPLGPRFSDPDGDTLSFTATGLPAGLTIDPATGTISGTIDHAASALHGGVYDSVVTADDGHGGTASETLHWTVTNPAPTARDDAATTREDQPIVIVVLANDSDPDGDPLTVVSAVAAHGSAIVNPDGTITYMPAPDFNGTDTIHYTIDDGNGGRSSAEVTVTVTPVNDAPTSTGLPPRSTADGAAATMPTAPAFSDVDGDTLSYTATGLPPGLTIDPATGVIGGTIASGSANGGPGGDGVYHAVITATDPSGATASAPFDWTVTQGAPVARDDHATTQEDTPVTIPVLANDTDPDNDPLTIVDATATHGTVYIANGTLVFYPAPDFNGVASVSYTIADPAGHRATATVTIDVTPVNDAPVATRLPAETASDAQTVTLDVGGFFRDPDGDTLSFAATGLPAGLVIDPATGRISGTLDRGASQVPGGVYHVTVTATDPSGAVGQSSFDWTIVNPAPVARDDAATTPEDTSVVIPVLANDGDPDGDALSVVAADAGHGSVAIGADGTLTYTPNANFNGNDVILYTISDGNGGRSTASVLVTVTPVNDAPTLVQAPPAVPATTDSAPLAIDTAPWFTDVDGDTLRYSATGLPAGLTIDPASGAIRGTIDHSASQVAGGVYAVTVTARDPSGAGTAATFDIRVTNPAPIATDDVAATTQDSAGIVIPVLANDRDPDGDPLSVVTAVADHGTTTINPDGTVSYVPGANFAGADTIHYTISDGEGGTAGATVAITVAPVEHPPVAGTVAPVDAIGGRPVGIAVLPAASDRDGDPLTVIGATTATGTVTVNPDYTIRYTPPLGFVGTTTIGYTISDGRGGTATGTVIVRVAQGRAADIEQLLRIGRVTFNDPTPSLATVTVTDGVIRNPLSLLDTVDGIRSLRGTTIGKQPVGDAVEAIQSLRGTSIAPDAPVTAEVARLDAIRDQRDIGDRLFDQRWGDFMVKGLTGFSAAADQHAGIMVESVVHGGAIYLEVRDTADDGRCPVRSVDIRLAGGGKAPAWIKVDPRGMAIIERGADMDELHLVVRVTRTDGHVSSTPILVQGQTGEVELDRHPTPRAHAAPLDRTLQTPSAAIHSEAQRLASYFQ